MKLLLHVCCGPCSCYPLKKLRADGIEPVGWFFNPNIHPYKEWDTRLKAAKEFAAKSGMELWADENYRLRDFLRRALTAEPASPAAADGTDEAERIVNECASRRRGRCLACYSWRLGAAAEQAAEHGFDAFSSTLFYSVYQDHEVMKAVAEHFAKAFKVDFYYEDFRVGWQEGIDISLSMGLYRQAYCGCIFSEEERYSRKILKAKKKAGRAAKAARRAREAKEEA